MIRNTIFIARHGESENNLLGIECSTLENKHMFGLTAAGRKQIEDEAKKFNDFDLVMTSPFRRAVETAHIFAHNSQCEIIEDELLSEVHYGDFELCSYKESDAWYMKNGSDDSVPFPGGESLLDAQKRAADFLQRVNHTYANKRILIVTHGHMVLFLQELLDKHFDMQHARAHFDDDASRKVIDMSRPSYEIR